MLERCLECGCLVIPGRNCGHTCVFCNKEENEPREKRTEKQQKKEEK